MFKVYQRGNGYRISVGDHRPTNARDLNEVEEALEHYYCGGASGRYHDAPGARTACPFCRDIAARRARRGEKA